MLMCPVKSFMARVAHLPRVREDKNKIFKIYKGPKINKNNIQIIHSINQHIHHVLLKTQDIMLFILLQHLHKKKQKNSAPSLFPFLSVTKNNTLLHSDFFLFSISPPSLIHSIHQNPKWIINLIYKMHQRFNRRQGKMQLNKGKPKSSSAVYQ